MLLKDLKPGDRFALDSESKIVFLKTYRGLYNPLGMEINAVQLSGDFASPGTIEMLPFDCEVVKIK